MSRATRINKVIRQAELDTRTAPSWQPSTAYTLGQRVLNPYGEVVVATAHTSDTAYDASKFKQPAPITPSMTIYETAGDPFKEVIFQDASTLYACGQTSAGAVYKSTDDGVTWALKGSTGFSILNLVRVSGTNTLIATELTNRALAGQNPKIARSTDDGVTWTNVATLAFPGLGHQDIISPANGVILCGEYGNVGNTVYSIKRSTDDGLTWAAVLSSPGTDSASDPGHIHAITRDPVNGNLVAFMDRSNPDLYMSTDNGATWTKFGTSTQPYHPNFVAPMYFDDYIAWGVDNQSLGKIYRLPRADFYAGNWEHPEVVAQLNGKVFYDNFPVRPGTYVISGASEAVGGDAAGSGSYAQEVYIVTDNGATVSGGVSHSTFSVNVHALLGQKATLPGYPASQPDQKGRSWINFNIAGAPSALFACPYSVGVAPAMPHTQSGFIGQPILANNAGIRQRDTSGSAQQILNMGSDASNTVTLINPVGASPSEFRLITGVITALFSGVAVFTLTPSTIRTNGFPILMSASSGGLSINSRAGTPEGALTAPPGSICFNTTIAAGEYPAYLKLTGTGNTGWTGIGVRKTGTATLVGGTVTIADTSITASSVIRIANKTIGGTPGALFVSAKAAGTSFTITSTSATDTSVIQYDVVTY